MASAQVLTNIADSTAFKRIVSYPIINYAYTTTTSTYDAVKKSNSYVKGALEFGESNVSSCTQTLATPVVAVLSSYKVDVDKTGCDVLDKLETGAQYISDVGTSNVKMLLDSVDKNVDYFLPQQTSDDAVEDAADDASSVEEVEEQPVTKRITELPKKVLGRVYNNVWSTSTRLTRYVNPVPAVRTVMQRAYTFVDGAKINGLYNVVREDGEGLSLEQSTNQVTTMAVGSIQYALALLHGLPSLPSNMLVQTQKILASISVKNKTLQAVQKQSILAIERAHNLVNSVSLSPTKLAADLKKVLTNLTSYLASLSPLSIKDKAIMEGTDAEKEESDDAKQAFEPEAEPYDEEFPELDDEDVANQ